MIRYHMRICLVFKSKDYPGNGSNLTFFLLWSYRRGMSLYITIHFRMRLIKSSSPQDQDGRLPLKNRATSAQVIKRDCRVGSLVHLGKQQNLFHYQFLHSCIARNSYHSLAIHKFLSHYYFTILRINRMSSIIYWWA